MMREFPYEWVGKLSFAVHTSRNVGCMEMRGYISGAESSRSTFSRP